jgi:hypothetical protein
VLQVYDIIGGKRRLEQIEREKQMLAQEEWMPNRSPRTARYQNLKPLTFSQGCKRRRDEAV